eukprot:scaffold156765_cov51-Prasinocladus_malaysianus.AAC.2
MPTAIVNSTGVDLSVILAFARMRKLLGIESKNPEDVPETAIQNAAEALQSAASLVVSDDGKRVRRKEPLGNVEEAIAAQDARSVHVGPFPYDATLDELTSFMKQHGEVLSVRMRRHTESKDFRGSIFVEFDSVETAKKVASMDLTYAEAPLKVMGKPEFKEEVIEKRHKRTNSPYNTGSNRENGGREDGAKTEEYAKGLIVRFTFKVARGLMIFCDAHNCQRFNVSLTCMGSTGGRGGRNYQGGCARGSCPGRR